MHVHFSITWFFTRTRAQVKVLNHFNITYTQYMF